MITLILLHPLQPIPAQSWTFADDEPAIFIGRAADNHVVLYSAVVSRRHIEVKRVDNGWEVANLGANGTYVDGQAIVRVPVTDGLILRLASSGPQIKIRLEVSTAATLTESQVVVNFLLSRSS
ncbi:Forkhead-associated protein [Westiellopsis prolifica IICB1]|nr:Forkhead-associated protein [Westiellopsis prolifica IICB1]